MRAVEKRTLMFGKFGGELGKTGGKTAWKTISFEQLPGLI